MVEQPPAATVDPARETIRRRHPHQLEASVESIRKRGQSMKGDFVEIPQ